MDDTTSSVRRSLSILRNITNRNTTIRCVATAVSSTGDVIGVPSEPVLFKIQGLLDAPSNLVLSEADNQHMRRLSWDEPFLSYGLKITFNNSSDGYLNVD